MQISVPAVLVAQAVKTPVESHVSANKRCASPRSLSLRHLTHRHFPPTPPRRPATIGPDSCVITASQLSLQAKLPLSEIDIDSSFQGPRVRYPAASFPGETNHTPVLPNVSFGGRYQFLATIFIKVLEQGPNSRSWLSD